MSKFLKVIGIIAVLLVIIGAALIGLYSKVHS